MTPIFNLSQSFPPSPTPTPTPIYTVKAGESLVQGVVSAGPMPDATTVVNVDVQVDRLDGRGWVNVGGVDGTGGMSSSAKGGPLDTPVTVSATTYCAVAPGQKVRGLVLVTGPSAVTVSFAGNIG